jgi:predicted permease
MRRGRVFQESDNEGAPRVAVINDTLAQQQFKEMDPIGQHIVLHGADSQPYEIVGVVGGSRQFSLARDPAAEIFTPYRQSRIQFMYILAKTHGDPSRLADPIRGAVHDIDADQPVGNRTLEFQFERAVAGPRAYALLITVFAVLALVLAAVGIYGVLSYLVTQRTREIGIRMALGASRQSIWSHVIGRGLLLAMAGLGVGVAASLLVTRAIAGLLYRVGAGDPVSLAGAAAVLLLMAILACAFPARRATKVDPMIALRYE